MPVRALQIVPAGIYVAGIALTLVLHREYFFLVVFVERPPFVMERHGQALPVDGFFGPGKRLFEIGGRGNRIGAGRLIEKLGVYIPTGSQIHFCQKSRHGAFACPAQVGTQAVVGQVGRLGNAFQLGNDIRINGT